VQNFKMGRLSFTLHRVRGVMGVMGERGREGPNPMKMHKCWELQQNQ
jgi:hypothetical protein